MVGHQATVPSYSHRELVVTTGRLTGHKIQLKNATGKKSRERERGNMTDRFKMSFTGNRAEFHGHAFRCVYSLSRGERLLAQNHTF